MKRRLTAVWLLILLCLQFTFAGLVGAALHEVDMEGFYAEFSDFARSNNLTVWGEAEQNAVFQLAQKHRLLKEKTDLSDYAWSAPGLAFYAICEAAYGPGRHWTLEQSHRYSVAAYESGLEDKVKYLMPPEDAMDQEEVVAMAKAAIHQKHDAGLMHCDIARLEGCTAHVLYVQHEPAPIWIISFYHEEFPLRALFSVEIFDESLAQASCFDTDNLYNLYAAWRSERELALFRFWSIEDQYRFRQLLQEKSQRQVALYGEIPAFADTILSRKHSLPEEGDMLPDEAIRIAERFLLSQKGIQEEQLSMLRPSVMFFREDAVAPVYEIRYYEGQDIRHQVWIDAQTSEPTLP